MLRRERGQGNIIFPCSADHDQDWQPYTVDPYSAIVSDDQTYMKTYYMPIIVGVGKETHNNWSMVIPEKAASTRHRNYLVWSCITMCHHPI